MIRGLHGLLYSSDAEASRAFFRDKLQLPFSDVGGGWLIFDLPEGDLGFHPADEAEGGSPGTHSLSFYCDDLHGTVADLRARGVEFKSEVADHGYGWVTYFMVPGGIEVQLYEPKYQKQARPATRPRKASARAARKPARAARKPARAARKPARGTSKRAASKRSAAKRSKKPRKR